MRKSIILASLLFGSSAFAEPVTFQLFNSQPPYDAGGMCGESDPRADLATYGWDNQCETQFMVITCSGDMQHTNEYFVSCGTCGAGTTLTSINGQQICRPNSCSAGFSVDGYGICSPTPPTPPDPNHPLGEHDGDEAGCNGAGGYYMASGDCNTLGEAVSDIFGSPTAVVGALLTVGGVAFGAAGIAALPITAGGSAGAVSVGGHATAVGLGMMGFAGANAMFNPTVTPASNDVSSGEYRMKISLKSVSGAGGGEASVVTKSNTTTGKVEQATYVPPTTKAALSDPSYVNKTDGTLVKPIPLTGTQNTTYDYVNNTATTTTHEAGSTSANPITSTKTTTITVTQNTDGTITTNTTDPAVAPSVTGSGGGSVSSSSSSSTTGWGTGTGTTSGAGAGDTGTGPDYTGVLNDIKKNTGDSASFLDQILGMFDNDTEVNTALADGSDSFGDYQGDIEGSFDGFIYTDPLGLNNIAGGSSIPEYGFTIMGTHFTIMDQALLNQLPLDLLRGLFLFMAALAGFITVFSGV